MSKIIISKNNKTGKIDFKVKGKIEAVEGVHLLSCVLVSLVKEYETAENKKDFQRIMGLYYDTEE